MPVQRPVLDSLSMVLFVKVCYFACVCLHAHVQKHFALAHAAGHLLKSFGCVLACIILHPSGKGKDP